MHVKHAAKLARLLSGGAAHELYDAMGNLTDQELDQLMVLVPVLCFGQQDPDRFDADESLSNRIAAVRKIDGLRNEHRRSWLPRRTERVTRTLTA